MNKDKYSNNNNGLTSADETRWIILFGDKIQKNCSKVDINSIEMEFHLFLLNLIFLFIQNVISIRLYESNLKIGHKIFHPPPLVSLLLMFNIHANIVDIYT